MVTLIFVIVRLQKVTFDYLNLETFPLQLLYLWDLVLAYDSMEVFPLLAAAIMSFRKENLMSVSTYANMEAVLSDLSSLPVVPLLQLALERSRIHRLNSSQKWNICVEIFKKQLKQCLFFLLMFLKWSCSHHSKIILFKVWNMNITLYSWIDVIMLCLHYYKKLSAPLGNFWKRYLSAFNKTTATLKTWYDSN